VSSQRHATVVGLGSVLPERVVPNEWFESFIDTSDEWIRERTGIRERHYALDGQTTSDLATDATRRALEAAAIERAEALAAERRIRAVRLNVAGAFHSPLMEPAVGPLAAAIDEVTFAPPRFPIASNVTGALVTDPQELRALAERQVVFPVRWESCAWALRAVGADTFVEAGPGDVLTKLAKRVVPGARALAVGSPDAAASLATERA